MKLLPSIIVSSSPFLVSLPFTITDLNRFEEDQPRALWQPPNYVFGIVWPFLYASLFMFNYLIFQNPSISNYIKSFVARDTLIESAFQGLWLYNFRFQENIKERAESYKKSLLFMLSLVFISIYRCYIIFSTKELKPYSLLYLPYALWINFAHILNWQLALGFTK